MQDVYNTAEHVTVTQISWCSRTPGADHREPLLMSIYVAGDAMCKGHDLVHQVVTAQESETAVMRLQVSQY